MNFEIFHLAIPEPIDPWHGGEAEMNHEVEDVVTVDLDAVTMMVLVDACHHKTVIAGFDFVGDESRHEVDGGLHTLVFDLLVLVDEVARGANDTGNGGIRGSLGAVLIKMPLICSVRWTYPEEVRNPAELPESGELPLDEEDKSEKLIPSPVRQGLTSAMFDSISCACSTVISCQVAGSLVYPNFILMALSLAYLSFCWRYLSGAAMATRVSVVLMGCWLA